eukprot:GILJ01007019.1.p1 GENE.GILJ01007019.1~~GILJ01007019.1.p1  ORF type:complete len:273 (-),score=45.25 GILJ01007019.1:223-1041(-)
MKKASTASENIQEDNGFSFKKRKLTSKAAPVSKPEPQEVVKKPKLQLQKASEYPTSKAKVDMTAITREAPEVRVFKLLNQITSSELQSVEKTFKGPHNFVTETIADIFSEFLHASQALAGESERKMKERQALPAVLPNPRNVELTQKAETLQTLLTKFRAEKKSWEEQEKKWDVSCNQTVKDTPVSERQSMEIVGTVDSCDSLQACKKTKETAELMMLQLDEVNKRIRHGNQVISDAAEYQAKLSAHMGHSAFNGYAHVDDAKSLVKLLAAS